MNENKHNDELNAMLPKYRVAWRNLGKLEMTFTDALLRPDEARRVAEMARTAFNNRLQEEAPRYGLTYRELRDLVDEDDA